MFLNNRFLFSGLMQRTIVSDRFNTVTLGTCYSANFSGLYQSSTQTSQFQGPFDELKIYSQKSLKNEICVLYHKTFC